MPVDVNIGDKILRLEVPAEGLAVKIEEGVEPKIDPENWLLYQNPFPETIVLESSILDSYTGTYETEFRNRLRKIEISREGSSLFINSRQLPKVQLYPSSKTEFFTKVSDNIRFIFNLDEGEKIESVTYNIFPREITYTKSNKDSN
jgi:hypothetical protein